MEPPAHPASICPSHSTSLWKYLTVADTAFFLRVQYTPVLGGSVTAAPVITLLPLLCAGVAAG